MTSHLRDFEGLVVRARVAAGTSWDGEDGGHGNRTPSQESEVRNILRDCANAIERLARSADSFVESLDNIREAIGQEETHHLVMGSDVEDLVRAVELCNSVGGDTSGCRAMLVLQKLRRPQEGQQLLADRTGCSVCGELQRHPWCELHERSAIWRCQ
jgi:hypothetical protein